MMIETAIVDVSYPQRRTVVDSLPLSIHGCSMSVSSKPVGLLVFIPARRLSTIAFVLRLEIC